MPMWNFEDVPICDDGVELAMVFLNSAAQAVELIEVEDAEASRSRFTMTFNVLYRHRVNCDKPAEI